MLRMMRSELMLNTALVIRWFVAAEHCAGYVSTALPTPVNHSLEFGGTAKYCLNGRHHTPK